MRNRPHAGWTLSAVLALALTGALPSPAMAVTNLLVNGSFETGSLAGWTYTKSWSDQEPNKYKVAVIYYNRGAAYPNGAWGEAVPPANLQSGSPDAPGTRALYFPADVAKETISQKVYLNPGWYTGGYSAYIPRNGAGRASGATMSASFAGNAVRVFDTRNEKAATWINMGTTFNVTQAGWYDAAFVYNAPGRFASDIVFDRAFLIAVPEPAAWAMMILGFGVAGSVLRTRRAPRPV